MWAGSVAYPSAPDEYNEAAVDRLMQRIDSHVVRVKGVRPQFEPENRVEMMNFRNAEERAYYDDTEARYYREKAKLEQDILDGKEIFLCWEDGEEDIEYWHDLEAGYAGRQKL